ncbi:Cytochrome c oxidase polypeptide I, partial [hydrothermal vent metagenome]
MTTINTTHDSGHDGHHDEGSYLTPIKGGFIVNAIRWATTIDHKKIGMMYLVAVLFMFFLGGMMAMAVRAELWEPTRVLADGTVTGQLFQWGEGADKGYENFNRIFTIHGAVMVFLVIIPGVPAVLG